MNLARITVTDATEAFLEKYRNREVKPPTLAKYKTFTNQLGVYCLDRGYVHIDQLGVIDMGKFYGSWTDV